MWFVCGLCHCYSSSFFFILILLRTAWYVFSVRTSSFLPSQCHSFKWDNPPFSQNSFLSPIDNTSFLLIAIQVCRLSSILFNGFSPTVVSLRTVQDVYPMRSNPFYTNSIVSQQKNNSPLFGCLHAVIGGCTNR